MAKKKKCPECPPVGAPAYMTTYGDMMTLLVTFFVLLISFSSMQESKFQKAMGSLKGALGVLKADRGQYVMKPRIQVFEFKSHSFDYEIEKILQQLEEATERTGTHDQVKYERSKDRIHFSISNPMLFTSGEAILKNEANEILMQIGRILSMVPFEVRVEGHTDDIPIHTARFPSNWELSAGRALAVVRKFIEFDIPPERFQVIGFGEYRPIANNKTAEGRAQNRRVEIYVNLKSELSGQLLDFEAFDK